MLKLLITLPYMDNLFVFPNAFDKFINYLEIYFYDDKNYSRFTDYF